MNYLQLVQKAASESGMVPGAGPPGSGSENPVSLTGITDAFVRRIPMWVADAWSDVQGDNAHWLWMREEFTGTLFTLQRAFSATELGVSRVAAWLPYDSYGNQQVRLYDPDIGASDEALLWYLPWPDFQAGFGTGAYTEGRPSYVSIDERNRLVFDVTPDKAYKVRGSRKLSKQRLSAPDDTPEMPEDWHDLIVYRALLKADWFDQGTERVPYYLAEASRLFAGLVDEQSPKVVLG